MTTVVTWNMQGANWTSDMKWRTGVSNLFANGADVACLQECGPVPASAALLWQSPVDPLMALYTWGTLRSRKYILFYHWDLLGNRCNLAIVTRQAIGPANVLPTVLPAVGPAWRPAIGITLGLRSYYSVHGISGGGPDVPGLLAAINLAAPGIAIVGGDFNRPPGGAMGGMGVCPPSANTHSTRHVHPANRYDYMYTNWPALAGTVGTVIGLLASDHFPVEYDT